MFQKRGLEINCAIILLFVSLICFFIHFLFFRYSFPPVNVDEASFFSPAYSFAKHGILSSNIHESFLPGSSRYTYWIPPFYLVLLGLFLNITGTTIINAKVLSLILTCLSAVFISTISNDKYIKISVVALFLVCPFIIITSGFIRVEALSILLIVLSIVTVRFHLNEYAIAIVAGLGIMTHPLLIPCAAALGVIMIRRGIRPFTIFSLIVVITISPYLFYIFKDVGLFKDQMALQFLRKSKAKFTDLKIAYILQSVPFALLAFCCLYKIEKEKELKVFLATSIVLSLTIVLRSNEFNYQVYLMPYVLAAVVIVMHQKRASALYRYLLPSALYVFFAILLISKAFKYHFRTDGEYKEMLTCLNNNRTWNGRHIYVAGNPDVASYFLMNNQRVERQIPVPLEKNGDWFNKYNYVVEVKDNNEGDNKKNESTREKPWITWKKTYFFTTSKGSHSMSVYLKE